MSQDADLFVRGPFTAEALAKTLAPCFSEALAVDYEHDGRPYWIVPDKGWPTLGTHDYEDDLFDPVRFPVAVSFHALHFSTNEERDAWLADVWRRWLPWLREAGAEEVLLVLNLQVPRARWSASEGETPPPAA
jgi:hypothetical protein